MVGNIQGSHISQGRFGYILLGDSKDSRLKVVEYKTAEPQFPEITKKLKFF